MNDKILKILLWILILIFGACTVFVFVNKKYSNNSKDDKSDKSDESKTGTTNSYFQTRGSESLFIIENIEKGELDGNTYSKIKIFMNNNTNLNANMDQYLFQLTDKDKKIINICYTSAYGTINASDIFPATVPANNEEEGYLYCNISDTIAKYLKMSYIIDGGAHFLGEDVPTGEYYFELEQ